MSDEVETAGPQMICGKDDCTRANKLRDALRLIASLTSDSWHPTAVNVNSLSRDALKEDQ